MNGDPQTVLRRSDRQPLYSAKYQQYRARLLNEDGKESSSESEQPGDTSSSEWIPDSSSEESDYDLAMAALNMSLHDHDPSKPYNPVSIALLEPYIPISYKDAIFCEESHKWIYSSN